MTTDKVLPELDRLDAWSFWIAPGEDLGVDRVVVGITGAFAIVLNAQEGYVDVGMGRIRIGGATATSVRTLRARARALSSRLRSMSVPPNAEAVLCCTQAHLGMPRQVKGVWIARPADLPRLIAHRPNVMPRQTAKRVAQNLGAKMRSARPDNPEG